MTVMTIEDLRQMLLFVADRMISSKPYLTEVDSKIGDGDHGIGMEIGFQKVKSVLSLKPYDNAAKLFQDAGLAMLNSMGGASGVIFGTLFLGGVKLQQMSAVSSCGVWALLKRGAAPRSATKPW